MLRTEMIKWKLVRPIILLFIILGSLEAQFVAPRFEVLPLRRDTIPLTSVQQEKVAQLLCKLALRENALTTAKQRRATAQLLAISAALAPDSKWPQTLAIQMSARPEELDLKPFDNKRLDRFVTILDRQTANHESELRVVDWLASPLNVAAPGLMKDQPPTGKIRNLSAKSWQKIVAPIKYFQPPPEKTSTELIASSPNNTELKNAANLLPEDKPNETRPLITESDLVVSLPLLALKASKEESASFGHLHDISVVGIIPEKNNNPKGPKSDAESLAQYFAKNRLLAEKALRSKHEQIELNRLAIELNFGAENLPLHYHHPLSALPYAVIADACLNDNELVPNLVLLGKLNESGQLSAPSQPFLYLSILAAQEVQEPVPRLIIAEEMKSCLTAFLIAENYDIFSKYDIFTAANLEEVIDLALLKNDTEQRVEALAQAREIRQAAQKKVAGSFYRNSFVIERLEKLTTAAPRHIGASLLLQKGRDLTPQRLNKSMTAQLGLSALAPILPFLDKIPTYEDKTDIEYTQSIIKSLLLPYQGRTEFNDRMLLNDTLDVIEQFNAVSTKLTSRDNFNPNGVESYTNRPLTINHANLCQDVDELHELLVTASSQ